MQFIFSYNKSLMAGGLAFLAVICAGLWLRSRTVVLNELTETSHNLKMQMAGGQAYPAVIADYTKRLETLRTDAGKITSKFVGRDYEAPMLVRAVVEAASRAGMEMTNAARQDKKTKALATQGKGLTVEVLSHAIALRGSYTALVKFLQNLASWDIGYKIESMEITPAEEGKAEDKIEISLVLSVFLIDQ
ncbi:MAG: hypothetical protein Q7J98_14190 [Kiritimatiellia bacterium]|nr:hypothetical protein [Kiritimatiellia bacterium]